MGSGPGRVRGFDELGVVGSGVSFTGGIVVGRVKVAS